MGGGKEKWPLWLTNMEIQNTYSHMGHLKQLLPMVPWALSPPLSVSTLAVQLPQNIATQHILRQLQCNTNTYTLKGSKIVHRWKQRTHHRRNGCSHLWPQRPHEEGNRYMNNISVYSTEMIALIDVLKHIHNKGYQRTVILSDSLTAL